MDTLFYALVKFFSYSFWCLLGFYVLAPTRVSLWRAFGYGALRWLLGLFFGVAAAIALGSVSAGSVGALYVGVYVPLRVIEWTIMAYLIHRPSSMQCAPVKNARVWLWVLGGILVSFASDLASPEGMAGRFCVGRCLC
ncbi:MAG: hypothetical protein LBQ81_01610 [Zoogloeaceae bacterium]|jgi:hypothetical protein|nr:hypothetical protein [Zoogloeaceae bacterium]